MNKQQLQQEIADLQKQLEEKQKSLAAMPEKWEPMSGCFGVGNDGLVHELCSSYTESRLFGVERETLKQAEKAAKAMRAHNRLLAYVAEFAPDYEFVKDDLNWFVLIDLDDGKWVANWHCSLLHVGNVYMPEHVAAELVKKLNSGEVEL